MADSHTSFYGCYDAIGFGCIELHNLLIYIIFLLDGSDLMTSVNRLVCEALVTWFVSSWFAALTPS